MDVDEVKAAKRILETDLNRLLKVFTQKTGLAVDKIELARFCEGDSVKNYETKVTLDV